VIGIVNGWFGRDHVRLVGPTPVHWSLLAETAASGQVRGPGVMDADLATLAFEHGASLATTDRGFRRFEGLRLIDPTAPSPART
jgi:predicted nucleic acid-binding protein